MRSGLLKLLTFAATLASTAAFAATASATMTLTLSAPAYQVVGTTPGPASLSVPALSWSATTPTDAQATHYTAANLPMVSPFQTVTMTVTVTNDTGSAIPTGQILVSGLAPAVASSTPVTALTAGYTATTTKSGLPSVTKSAPLYGATFTFRFPAGALSTNVSFQSSGAAPVILGSFILQGASLPHNTIDLSCGCASTSGTLSTTCKRALGYPIVCKSNIYTEIQPPWSSTPVWMVGGPGPGNVLMGSQQMGQYSSINVTGGGTPLAAATYIIPWTAISPNATGSMLFSATFSTATSPSQSPSETLVLQ